VWTKPYFKVKTVRLKCTKFYFGWGSTLNPAGGACSAPPVPLAGFKGPTSKGRGRGVEEKEVKEERGRGEGAGDTSEY